MHSKIISIVVLSLLFAVTGLAADQSSITPMTVQAPRYMNPQPPKKDIWSLYNTAIPHIVFGGTEWQTTFIFHNPSYVAEEFTVYFYDDNGNAASIPIMGGMYSSLHVQIPPFGTLKATTDYRAEVPPGWCWGHVDVLEGNFDNTYMQTLFKQHVPGQQDSEASVPAEVAVDTEQVLVFDQESGYVMGVALANPWLPATVRAEIYDTNGNLLATEQFLMPMESHTAFVLADRFPQTRNRVGSVVFTTDGWGLVGIALRFNPNGSFTSMPMLSAPLRETD